MANSSYDITAHDESSPRDLLVLQTCNSSFILLSCCRFVSEPIYRLRNHSTIQMLQSYDHSGEEMSRKRSMDRLQVNEDSAANDTAGGGKDPKKIMRCQGKNENDHNVVDQAEEEEEDNGNETVDPPARERPAVRRM